MKPATCISRLRILHCKRPVALSSRRYYAVQAPGAPTLEVFSNKIKYLQKERAAVNPALSREADYLKDEIAQRLVDRLLDIAREFPKVLDLGANSCNVARALAKPPLLTPEIPDDSPQALANKPSLAKRVHELICADTSPSMLHRDDGISDDSQIDVPMTKQVLPNLETLPYEPNTFDAVLSSMALHWVNDLPSLLASINSVLKPDAPFIAAMFGGDTLYELRSSLQIADIERRGGVQPHISPLADVRDIGGLLGKAGFKLLTVDVDDIIVEYPDTFALMQDIQAMGEGNAILKSIGGPIQRDVLLANEAIYRELHCKEDEKDRIPATFRIIYMIGWKEGKGQQQPLERGSGQLNMSDILGGGSVGGQ